MPEKFLDIQDFQRPAWVGFSKAPETQLQWFNLPISKTELTIQDMANAPSIEEPKVMTQDEFYNIVDNAIASWDFQWQSQEEVYNGMLKSVTQDWFKIAWIEMTPEVKTNKTVLSRIEEKARELAETEWELDLSNKNMFQRLMWETRLWAQAFSDVVEIALWETFETAWQALDAVVPEIIKEPITNQIKKHFDSFVWNPVSQAIWTSTKWIAYTWKEVFDMLPEPVQQEVENLWVIWLWALDFVWGWWLVKQFWKQVVKQVPKITKEISKTKNFLFPQESLDDLVSKASQAKTPKDLDFFKRGLDKIDATQIDSYKDLSKAFDEKIWAMSRQIDDILPSEWVFKLKDLTTTVGKRKTNFVEWAIDDLKKVWTKENDLELLSKVDDLEDIVKWSDRDINDLARFYGTKFKKKSFGKTGEPLSSVSAARFENNRTWLKNLVRDKTHNAVAKELDGQISELFTAKGLSDDMAKKVQALFNKTIHRWPLAWLWAKTVQLVNAMSWGAIWGALWALWIQSNIGKKTLDVLSIQKNLNKTLKTIKRMDEALDVKLLSPANKKFLEKFFADLDKWIGSASTKVAEQWEVLKGKLWDIADDLADKTWARAKFIDDTKGFKEVGTTKSAEVKTLTNKIKESTDKTIWYHWTNADFDKFLDVMIGKWATAKYWEWVYLSSSDKVAKTYADLLGWLKWGKPRLLEVAIPDSMNIKAYNWPVTWLKKAWEEAKKAWFQWIKFNTADDFIQIPWRKIDTVWHHNYIVFNPSDAKIIKNTVIKELWAVKWLWLIRDLLAGSVVWLSAVEIWLMLKEKFSWNKSNFIWNLPPKW